MEVDWDWVFGTDKSPRVLAAHLSEHLSRQHRLSPHLPDQHVERHCDSKINRLQTNKNNNNGDPALLLRRSLPRYIHPPITTKTLTS
jgi:hypothetical protein